MGNKLDKPNEPENKSGQKRQVPSPSDHTVSRSGQEQRVPSLSDHTVVKPQEQVVHPNKVSVCTCTCVLCLRVPPNTRDSLANQLHTILSLEWEGSFLDPLQDWYLYV